MFFQRKSRPARRVPQLQRRRHEFRVALARQSLKPQFEALEQRRLLATVTWDGGAGTFNWSDANNWDTNQFPGAVDDVVIPDLAGTQTINISGGFSAVANSINSAELVAVESLSGLVISGTSTSVFGGGLNVNATNNVNLGTAVIAGGNWSTSFTVIGTITNSGDLNLSSLGGPFTGNVSSITNNGTINLPAGGGNISLTVTNSSIGVLNLNTTDFLGGTIQNAGTINRTEAGTAIVNGFLDNTGTVNVTGGSLSLIGSVAQLSGPLNDRTLTAGTWTAAGGTIIFQAGNTIRTIGSGAAVSLVGSGSTALPGIFSGLTVAGTLSVTSGATLGGGGSGLTVTSTGTVTVGTGSTLNTWASMENAGTVIVAGDFPVAAYQQTAGLTRLDGGSLASSSFFATGGTLAGTGNIFDVTLTNAALAPGNSPGILNITGNLTLDASSVTDIEVQGTNPATPDFDQILVSGTATLGGTLNVSLLNGFYPDKSESFRIIQAASRVGDFATKNLPQRNGSSLVSTTPGTDFYDLTGTAYVVRNTNNSGAFSLRDQLINANANPGLDQLLFDINPGGIATITPVTALPTIISPIIIDGTSQQGYLSTPLIDLNGTGAGAGVNGMQLGVGSDGSTVQGLAINQFSGEGLYIESANNSINSNYIGTDPSGTIDLGNIGGGIAVLTGSNGNTITANLVSGNNAYGILLQGDSNKVQGNKVGTNASGNADLGNSLTGVWMFGGSNNIIGVDGLDGILDAFEGNLISGNDAYGVYFQGNSDNNVVAGNFIGTDVSGTNSVSNFSGGVVFFDDLLGDNNRIGTNADGTSDDLERNVISGNDSYGIVDYGVGTVITGNYIGTTVDGLSALANIQGGVSLAGPGGRVGGTAFVERNIISGNGAFGVDISTVTGTGNTILGNYIGTDISGVVALANAGNGIAIRNDASSNTIGGTTAGARNVISGNAGNGIFINSTSLLGNTIQGNYIGVDVSGTNDLGNDATGIFQARGRNQLIGGSVAGAGNVISGNALAGIEISGVNSTLNTVAGNIIGLNAAGTAAIPNSNQGLVISAGSTSNTIGGTTAFARNVISGNTDIGIVIDAVGSDNNIIIGNYIGTDSLGTTGIPNPSGIFIGGGTGNRIGTDGNGANDSAEGNVISGNTAEGINIFSSNNRVSGNYIGTDATGTIALSNRDAIYIDGSTSGNIIGTDGSNDAFNASERNIISGNLDRGILLSGANVAAGNWIGINVNGDVLANQFGLQVTDTGSRIGTNADGIADADERNVISGNSILGLIIRNPNTTGAVVAGNYIGTDPTGTLARPNASGIGIVIGANNITIGGTVSAARNVISGNNSTGISIDIGSNDNLVQGNYIGTDFTGLVGLGNVGVGVNVSGGSTGTLIGGSILGAGNVISGSVGSNGVAVSGVGTDGTIIQGNFIGTDKDGTSAIPNFFPGVAIINGAGNTQVGGLTATPGTGAGNIISGNREHGVLVRNIGTSDTLIQGNLIGLAAGGTNRLGNGNNGSFAGIAIFDGAANTTIGGTDPLARNIISGNENFGIVTLGSGGQIVTNTIIQGNTIGTNLAGDSAIGNGRPGIGILDQSSTVTVGGTVAGAGNLISGNSGGGIFVSNLLSTGAPTGVAIQGNKIGANAAGTGAIPNTVAGGYTGNGIEIRDASNVQVGGSVVNARNVISGNSGDGVLISGLSTGNRLEGNFIGTNAAGTSALANASGVTFQFGSTNNTIGGSALGARNIISGNALSGIQVDSNSNILQGNYIGLDVTGTVALANALRGVFVQGSGNLIGGSTSSERNVISGNFTQGVEFRNSGATDNTVQGNYIGTNALGDSAVGNGGNGLTFGFGASYNLAFSNVISGNQRGVLIREVGTDHNWVAGNFIGTNAVGNAAIPNWTTGEAVLLQNGVQFNVIGTNSDGVDDVLERNVISGNAGSGIGMSTFIGIGPSNNIIAGNFVGLAASGSSSIPNGGNGISVLNGSSRNTIGGTATESRNVISGNSAAGLRIDGSSTSDNVVQGNYIGTDAAGTAAIGNTTGVVIQNGATNTLIGGFTTTPGTGAGNLVSGNTAQGILDQFGAVDTAIRGNLVGLGADGSTDIGNGTSGIQVNGLNTLIGGDDDDDGLLDGIVLSRNVISGNSGTGINIGHSGSVRNTIVQGNYIGTNRNGTAAVSNSTGGVIVGSAPGTRIGGTTPGAGNVISGNAGSGLSINAISYKEIDGLYNAVVEGNLVGLNATGNAAISNSIGISLSSSTAIAALNGGNRIGGTDASARNVISGNSGQGILVSGQYAIGNFIAGNYIGTNKDGNGSIGNAIGIELTGDSSSSTIGAVSSSNIITASSIAGIRIANGSTSNSIVGNIIGSNAVAIAAPNGIGVHVLAVGGSNTISDNDVRFSTTDNLLIESAATLLSRNVSADISGLPIRLSPATLSPGSLTITQVVSGTNAVVLGEVNARAATTYTVELFSSPTLGQASRYVAFGTMTTDASGFASFSITPPPGSLNGFVHATLTGLGVGQTLPNTSPLSNGVLGTPAIILGLRSQSPEGTPITLTAFASTNPVTGYLWEVRKDGLPYAFELRTDGTQSDGGIQFTPDDEGLYTVSLRVTLDDGSQTLVGPFDINVYNVAPTPGFNYTPSTINVGTVVTLTSNNSDPGQLDVLKNAWEVRYGSTIGPVVFSSPLSTVTTAAFTPAAGGFYYATMTVDDGDGGARTLTREIAVSGLPASTTIVVPATTVLEGQTVRARAPESELNRTEQLTFSWGVTKTPASGPTTSYPFTSPSRGLVEFVPDDNGTYTISLTISDGVTNVVATPQQVVVGNVAPVLRIQSATGTLTANVPVNLTSMVTDPGAADTQTVVWTVMRDQQPFAGPASGSNFNFTPTLTGVYVVTATVTDDDGGIDSAERRFALIASPPAIPAIPAVPTIPTIPTPLVPPTPPAIAADVAISIVAPAGPYSEGVEYSFTAITPAAVATYAWSARSATGAKTASSTSPTFLFTPSQGGNYQIELTVTLVDGRKGQSVFTPMSVQGSAPTVQSLGVVSPTSSPIFEGTPVLVRTQAVDPRESIGLNYQWELKKPNESSFTILNGVDGTPTDFRFVPTNQGNYEVRVSVSDSQGLITTRSLTVGITNADPIVSINGLPDPGNANNVLLTATGSDPGFADLPNLRYEWSINAGAYLAPSASNTFSVAGNGLTNAKVRVTDGDGGSAIVDYFIIIGGATTPSTPFVINASVEATAGAADQILYLGTSSDDYVNIVAGLSKKVVVLGGLGNDTLEASTATTGVLLDGGQGNDTLIGGLGDDVLIAGTGTNVLIGGNGNNRFVGGGNDTMTGGVDADYYEIHFSTVVVNDTTGGNDTIDLTAAQDGVTLNLSDNTGNPQVVFTGSTLALTGSFENLIGSTNNDDLTSSTLGTTIDGGGGDDILRANADGVTLRGGIGNDTIVLTDAGGVVDGGSGNDSIIGTITATSTVQIATGTGNDIVNVQGPSATAPASVSISLGDGNNSLTATNVTGKIYGTNGGIATSLDAFGSASTTVSTIQVSGSSNIDIFGSAAAGSSVAVTGGSNVSIFGSGALSLTDVGGADRNSITTTIFGSASPTLTTASVSGSSNIDIFGSASSSGPLLTATVSGSSNVDIFGSAAAGISTVTVNSGSTNIGIFGSATPNGSSLNATVSASSNVDIFGSAAAGLSTVTVDSGSSNIGIFGSASSSGGALTASVNGSSNIDIFGSASTTPTAISVDGSSNVSIFGSASPTSGGLTATISSSTNVDIFGSATAGPTTVTATGTSDVSIFGSATPGTTTVNVINSTSNVGIFGSASPTGSNLNATVIASSNVGIFGSASAGTTTVSVTDGSSNIGIFGSASATGSSLTATVSGSSNVDIFGSASTGTTTVSVDGSSSNIGIFGSASATGSGLNASVSGSSNVDIFGSASAGGTTITLNSSTNIGIFGSASANAGNLSATIGSSSNIDIFGSASGGSTIVTATGSSNIGIFGSASPGTTNVSIVNSSSDIGIFGSASPMGSSLSTTVSGSSNVDIFGSAAAGGTAVVVSGSSNVGIFGSASPDAGGVTVTISSSSHIDIFGSASGNLTTVAATGSSDISIFGSASPGTTNVQVVNGSSNIGIFGSASATGSNLNATVSGSSNIDIFGSASSGTTTVSVLNGSSQISIFGSASPTGSRLDVAVSGSTNIGIFGSAAGNDKISVVGGGQVGIYGLTSGEASIDGVQRGIVESSVFGSATTGPVVVTVNSSSDVGIFGSATPGSILSATVSNSSNIDIFGSASPGSISVLTSQNVDIFGSAASGTTISVNGSSDINIFGGRGDAVMLENVTRTRVDGGVFGTASGPGITVSVGGGSSNVGIFGTSSADSVQVGKGSNIGLDLRGGNDTIEVEGTEHFVAIADDGEDSVTIRSGFDMLIYLGAGVDRAQVLGGDLIRIIGDEGNDEILLLGGSNLTVDGGEGNDKIFVTGGIGINVRGDAGDDEVDIFGGIGLSVSGGINNDRLRVFGSLGGALEPGKVYAFLDGQDGNDALEVRPLLSVADRGPTATVSVEFPYLYAPQWMTLPAWITTPTTSTSASSIALVGGSGTNALWLEGAQRLYGIGGDDVDTITLQTGSGSEVAGGRSADIITVRSTGSDNRVFGDQGDDVIDAYAGTRLGIFGEEGIDTIRFHGGQDGYARGGIENDILEVLDGNRLVLAGESGNDTLTIWGGTSGVAAGGVGDDTLAIHGGSLGLLLGQSGNDHLIVSGGTQAIVSGGDGDDLIEASNRGDDLYGDDGDDEYRILPTTTSGLLLRLRELLYVDPVNFEPEARGSDTIDLSAFSLNASLNLGTVGLFNSQTVGLQSIISSQLQLILLGSLENIIGTSANDVLIGNSEVNRIEGREGNDTLTGLGGDDILIGGAGNDILGGGDGDDVFIFGTTSGVSLGNDVVYEANGEGIDALDFSGMPDGLGILDLAIATPQMLSGGLLSLTLKQSATNAALAEVEEVVGTELDDVILGNALDNRIEPKGGSDTVDGRSGSDIYVFSGRNLGSVLVIDASSGSGRDTMDFVGFDAPVVLDLAITTPQNLGELILTFASGDSIENVLGSSYDDIILGNSLDNALYGGAGADRLGGRDGNDRLVADLPAVVLLDFDSAYSEARGDYNYSPDERNLIQQKLTATYAAFNWIFTQSESQAHLLSADIGRSYVRLAFSQGRGGGILGDAGEVDFRNIRRRVVTEVNINPLMPTIRELLEEQLGTTDYTVQQYSDMVVAFTATIAGHELAHTAGLRHGDAFGPIGSGLYVGTDPTNLFPEDSRPANGNETGWHVLSSPGSTGTPLADAAKTTFFGEREAIKMAFNEIGRTRRETETAAGSNDTWLQAEPLFNADGSLPRLYVPNLAPTSGFARSGQSFDVSAMAIVGDVAGATDRDFYRFTAQAGDYVNIELMVSSIRPLRGDPFDGEVRLYDANGVEIGFNDDDFEGTKDATLLDFAITTSGTYYVRVGLSEQPVFGTGGRYELFVSRFREGTAANVVGDTLIGGAGSDVIVGGAANDLILGSGSVAGDLDTIDGKSGYDTIDTDGFVYNYDIVGNSIENIIAPLNTPPVAQASSFTTNEDTAKSFSVSNFGFTDAEGDSLSSITITSLNVATGDTLKLNGTNVAVNQTISAGSIPNLIYTPASNANGSGRSTFGFKVNDTGLGTVAAVMTINVTAVNDPPTATFSLPTTSILFGTSFSVALTNPVDTDTASGFTYSFDVGSGYGAFGSASSISVLASTLGPILVKAKINDNQGGITEYTGTVNIVIATGSAYILNPTASGAVSAAGNANVNLAFGIFVYSNSSSAIKASGNARINVGGTVQVVGGISKSGNAQVTKTGTPTTTVDPLATLSSPSLVGLVNFGAVSVSGNTTKTLNPGIYSSIRLSGNARVTLNPGVYVIKGGGVTVSGNAAVSGSGITLFNTGSNYNGTTDGGNFGGIGLSGNGNINLNAPTTGPYAGILIYQSRVNTRALNISGNANFKTNGTIYAANAQLTMSGNGSLDDTLIVNTLVISGNVSLTQLADGLGSSSEIGGNANTLLAGDVSVYISSASGTFSPDMLARIREAITNIDTLLIPYNVSINEVSDLSLASVVMYTSLTSVNGTASDGVLGSYDPSSYPASITMLQGWDWYEGSDPSQIGSHQYDFQTSILHELGHALGLGHSADAASAMNSFLSMGTALRWLTVTDLNIPSEPEGAEPLMASGYVMQTIETELIGIVTETTPATDSGLSRFTASPLHSSQPVFVGDVRWSIPILTRQHGFEAVHSAFHRRDDGTRDLKSIATTRIDNPKIRSVSDMEYRLKTKNTKSEVFLQTIDAALAELYDGEEV